MSDIASLAALLRDTGPLQSLEPFMFDEWAARLIAAGVTLAPSDPAAPLHADQCILAADHPGPCMWVGGRRT